MNILFVFLNITLHKLLPDFNHLSFPTLHYNGGRFLFIDKIGFFIHNAKKYTHMNGYPDSVIRLIPLLERNTFNLFSFLKIPPGADLVEVPPEIILNDSQVLFSYDKNSIKDIMQTILCARESSGQPIVVIACKSIITRLVQELDKTPIGSPEFIEYVQFNSHSNETKGYELYYLIDENETKGYYPLKTEFLHN